MALYIIRPTGTIWDDGSDATSEILLHPTSGSPIEAGHALPATQVVGTVVRAQVFVRGRTLEGVEGGWNTSLRGPNSGLGIGNAIDGYEGQTSYTRLGTSFDWAHILQDSDWFADPLADALADLAAGQSALWVQATDAAGDSTLQSDIEISEAYIEIETAATVAPPCRKYPRSDALSNSPRRYPPPKSRQYGNRATGYW